MDDLDKKAPAASADMLAGGLWKTILGCIFFFLLIVTLALAIFGWLPSEAPVTEEPTPAETQIDLGEAVESLRSLSSDSSENPS